MGEYYSSVMDLLYQVSMWTVGIALLIMVTIIPIDIFTRYVLNNTLSWPEPVAILCVVTFTFTGAAVSYRTGSHIVVSMVTDRLGDASRRYRPIIASVMLMAISLFILWYGTNLCLKPWSQPVVEFPLLSAEQNYLPLPVDSAITLLLIAEKIFRGPQCQCPAVMLGSTSQLPSPFQKGKQMDAFILIFTLGIILAIGVPVAYAIDISAIIGAWYIDIPLEAVMTQLISGVNELSLLVIPFFILAGVIMAEGGIARRLVNFAYISVGSIRGGLSLINVMASAFFDAVSGSSMADTAPIGSVMIPEMDKKGYPCDFAVTATASGSVQVILTSSNHSSVIYSLTTDDAVSITTLFIAGILPGLLLSLDLMVTCVAFAHKRGYPKGERVPFRQALKILIDTLRGLMTVMIIIGNILSGIFAATESAAITYLWALFVTMFIYRDYKQSELPKLMFRTVKTVTIVMILIGFAAAFGAVMTYMRLPMRITETFTSISDNRYVILICIDIMLLLIGTLMNMAPLILILMPVLLPVTNALGIDPVHFGMIVLMDLGIGLVTPPVGSMLFVAGTASEQKIGRVVKAMLPFYLVLFLVLTLVTYTPAISLFLPKLFGVI